MFSLLAVGASLALLRFVYWLGTSAANAFNEQVFGRYYTAGAILMIGAYALVFFTLVGIAVASCAFAWMRNEVPVWLRWTATLISAIAPLVAASLMKAH